MDSLYWPVPVLEMWLWPTVFLVLILLAWRIVRYVENKRYIAYKDAP